MSNTLVTFANNGYFHKILNGEELSRGITLDDCWEAYQSDRKHLWTVTNMESRLKSAEYKLAVLNNTILDTVLKDALSTNGSIALDVGCGDGAMGAVFAKKYNLVAEYADIANNLMIQNVTFYQFDSFGPIPTSEKYNVIACFHILHHIPTLTELQFRLKDIYSLLKPNGLLLIREHDAARGSELYTRIKWQHIAYELHEIKHGLNKEELLTWITNYYLNTYSAKAVQTLICDASLVYIGQTKPTHNDGSYYAMFKKISKV